jgi:hypothetical protein
MMSFSQFFGEQSAFQIIVAAVAFITAVYTFYKSFLERARIRLFPADRVGLVLAGSVCAKFHLRGSLVNQAVKVGTVHRLEACIITPSNTRHSYVWNLLFSYVPGTLDVEPASSPIPLSVAGKSSQSLHAEFEAPPLSTPITDWSIGRYKVEITGWVNKGSRKQSPNLNAVIHFSLDASQANRLLSQKSQLPSIVDIPVEEWGP